MKKFLPILIIIFAAGIGGGGGFFLKSQSSPKAPEEALEHGEAPSKSKKEKKKKGGHGSDKDAKSEGSYLKFSRQFVIPIVSNGKPLAIMLFDINIVIDPSIEESAYVLEPKLRDLFLEKFLTLASSGILIKLPEEPIYMEQVKQELLGEAVILLGENALDILITDIAIQHFAN